MPSDAAIFALIDAAMAGAPIEGGLLREVLGDQIESLSPDEMNGLRAELERMSHLPRAAIAMFVKGALSQGIESFIRRLREKDTVTRQLFSAVDENKPLPLSVRSAFGVLSAVHERALRSAVERGSFTIRDASECYYRGEEVAKRLAQLRFCDVQLNFATADYQGMPVNASSATGAKFVDVVDIEAPLGLFQMLISNESELWQLAHPEEDTVRWLRETIVPNSVLVDVGANVGLYSLYAVSVCPDVLAVAFEPSPFSFTRLCENIMLNKITSIQAFPFAIADTTGISSFGITHVIPGGWSHGGLLPPSQVDSLRVGCVKFRLDDILQKGRPSLLPTHLKIDIDGLDERALRGALATLTLPSLRHVLIEVDDDRCVEVCSIIEPLGFELVNRNATGFCNRIYIKR